MKKLRANPTQKWMAKAACKDAASFEQSYDRFFPEDSKNLGPAHQLCHRCPVRPQCLDLAIANKEQEGIWAGMSWRQRNNERKRRDATKVEFEEAILPVVQEVAMAMASTPTSMSRILYGLEVVGGDYESSMLRLQGVCP